MTISSGDGRAGAAEDGASAELMAAAVQTAPIAKEVVAWVRLGLTGLSVCRDVIALAINPPSATVEGLKRRRMWRPTQPASHDFRHIYEARRLWNAAQVR
jgi:hypothetical protein